MPEKQDLPTLAFASPTLWDAWLAENHASSAGVWLKLSKGSTAEASLSYDQALDVALCYGWIDGQKNRFDDTSWLQKFTPRRPGSKWSQRNCSKATDLLAQGRMQPAGLREVEAAKASGRWDAAYAGASTATVPADLQDALDANPAARAYFASLDRQNRYAILYRIQDAVKPTTRAQRIAKFVAMLAEGKKLYP